MSTTVVKLLAGLTLLVGMNAQAGGRLPCEAARVFSHGAVNAFVLPYRDARTDTQAQGSAGWRLPVLIQQEVLMSLLKYGSVGVTELTQEGSKVCDPREVIAQVTRGSGSGSLQPGHGLVLIWGRVYEDGPNLFVQSYVRFLRREGADGISVPMPGFTGPELRLDATLPVQALAMPPRRLTQNDIQAIEARARKALVLYEKPDAQSKSKPFVTDPNTPFFYGVTQTRGEWMQISAPGQQGWVRARSDSADWSLRRFMPELAYLDAVAGYLRLRAAQAVPLTTTPKRLMDHVEAGFASFDKALGADAAPEAHALAQALIGVLQWKGVAYPPDDAARRAAAQSFAKAAVLMPESTMLRTLAAVSSPYRTMPIKTGVDALAEVDADLLGALALDGSNALVLRNLDRLYDRLDAEAGQTAYPSLELKRRRDLVKGLLR